ncbi:MAG: TraB/GumN family protein [Candidatus Aenigmatarchaeota archaeon]
MIRLLGTSHISPESVEQIKEEMDRGPDCVTVELDMSRYQALKSGERRSSGGIFFKLLSWLQKRLGKKTGVFPGEEMLTAVETAQKNDIDSYLIDQPISETLYDINRIGIKGKLKLVFSSLGLISPVKIDLNEVPSMEIVNKVTGHLKKYSPEIYRALVEKRDESMAESLEMLSEKYDKILAVVGVGHIPGMYDLLKKKGLDVEKTGK